MPISEEIVESSLEEMKVIFSWVKRKSQERRVVLIGGWAVYLFNQYYGSVDIDLITSSKTRSRLTNFLTKQRDFIWERRLDIDDRVLCKKIDNKSIDIDFGTMEVEDRFEDRTESLSMGILN